MLTLSLALLLSSQGSPKMGQAAPDFALKDQSGAFRSLHDYKGRTVVLMFYPKDFTPG